MKHFKKIFESEKKFPSRLLSRRENGSKFPPLNEKKIAEERTKSYPNFKKLIDDKCNSELIFQHNFASSGVLFIIYCTVENLNQLSYLGNIISTILTKLL